MFFLVLLFTAASYAYIEDNSFLLNEAYNQSIEQYQIIFKHQNQVVSDETESAFEFEAPVSEDHQFSFELPFYKEHRTFETKPEDAFLFWQIVTGGNEKHRMVDRLGLVLPTGDVDHEAGYGVAGIQYMKALTLNLDERWQNHWNLLFQIQPNAKSGGTTATNDVHMVNLGTSLVYHLGEKFDLLFETLYVHRVRPRYGGRIRTLNELFLNPGLRFEKNLPWNQTKMVPGISFPVEVLDERTDFGVMLYLSFEPHFE